MHAADTLIALGGAFLVCGLLARIGVPVGLPTIPLFHAGGRHPRSGHPPASTSSPTPTRLAVVARLGLVFLLFYLGLEFSLDDLTSGGKRLAGAAGVYLLLNVGGGLALGFSLGWGVAEALVVAAVVGISSSAIVTKLLVETGRIGNPETRVILGIAVMEDIFLAFYLALLQPVLGGADGLVEAATGIATAFTFLFGLAWSPGTARGGWARSSTPPTRRSWWWSSSASPSSPRGWPRRSACPTRSAPSWSA